jgi:predicted ATPase
MTEKHYLREIPLKRGEIESFKAYPFSLAAVRNLKTLKLHPAVTFIIGENGVGKSTLLEAIAVAWGFNPEGGSKNFNFTTRSSHSELGKHLKLIRGVAQARDGYFLRAESFFNVATEIDNLGVVKSYGGRSSHEQSHGESFLSLFLHRFEGHGLYILDEPEAALSPTRQMSVLARMHELVRKNSQFIVATHSPIIMAYPQATIYTLTEDGIIESKYEETEHYRTAREFLNNHGKMLKILME